jgi:glycine cleavage system H protein
MKIDEYDLPDELYYHDEHSWLRIEGDVGIIGLNDFAQKLAGTIKRVVTLEEDEEVSQGKPCGTISSGKWTGKLYSPVSGEIIEVNEEVEDDPKLINESPYDEGWVLKVKLSDKNEISSLYQGDNVVNWLQSEITKHKK